MPTRFFPCVLSNLCMCIGFVCLYLYKLGYEPRDVAPLLVYIFIPAFFGDVVRFAWPSVNRLWTRVMCPLMRDREKQEWNGVIFYLLGAWTVLSFFPKVPRLQINPVSRF